MQIPVPFDCEISALHAYMNLPPGAGETLEFMVFCPGVTALLCTIAGAVDTQADNLVDAIAVQRGDLISIRIVASLNCAAANQSASILMRRI